MDMERVTRYSLPADVRSDVVRGSDLLKCRAPAGRVEMLLVHPDGTRETVEVFAAVTDMIADLLERASTSDAIALLTDDAEISPEDAAAILGVSRPLVRRRMDLGDLPFRRVGAHRRIRLADVLEAKHRDAPIRDALEELRVDTEDLVAHGLWPDQACVEQPLDWHVLDYDHLTAHYIQPMNAHSTTRVNAHGTLRSSGG